MNLPPGWYTLTIAPGANPLEPGVLEWRIEGGGTFEAPYSDAGRTSREAGRHILRLAAGQPWSKSNPKGYPETIRALAQAHAAGRRIEMHILRNTPPTEDAE